jgi:hypothetical protein
MYLFAASNNLVTFIMGALAWRAILNQDDQKLLILALMPLIVLSQVSTSYIFPLRGPVHPGSLIYQPNVPEPSYTAA